MKVRRHSDGARVTLDEAESGLLTGLLADLVRVLAEDGLQPGDPVYDRLYPAGYSGPVDEQAQQEFRDLTTGGLREERVGRAQACLDDVAPAALDRGRVDLDADGCDRWIRVVNDLRLTLGTRLEITEDGDHWQLTEGPDATAMLVYGWLTELQERIVQTVLG